MRGEDGERAGLERERDREKEREITSAVSSISQAALVPRILGSIHEDTFS